MEEWREAFRLATSADLGRLLAAADGSPVASTSVVVTALALAPATPSGASASPGLHDEGTPGRRRSRGPAVKGAYVGTADGRMVEVVFELRPAGEEDGRRRPAHRPEGHLETRARVSAAVSVVSPDEDRSSRGLHAGGSLGSRLASGRKLWSFRARAAKGMISTPPRANDRDDDGEKKGAEEKRSGGGGGGGGDIFAPVTAIRVIPARRCVAALSAPSGVTLHFAEESLRPRQLLPGTSNDSPAAIETDASGAFATHLAVSLVKRRAIVIYDVHPPARGVGSDGGASRTTPPPASPLREIRLDPHGAALRVGWHADRLVVGTAGGYLSVDGGTGAVTEILPLLPRGGATEGRNPNPRGGAPKKEGAAVGRGGGGGDEETPREGGSNGPTRRSFQTGGRPASLGQMGQTPALVLLPDPAAVLVSGNLGVVCTTSGEPKGNPLVFPGANSAANSAGFEPRTLASVPPYVVVASTDATPGAPALVFDRSEGAGSDPSVAGCRPSQQLVLGLGEATKASPASPSAPSASSRVRRPPASTGSTLLTGAAGVLVAARGSTLEVWRAVPLDEQVRALLVAGRLEDAAALAETDRDAPVATLDDASEDDDDSWEGAPGRHVERHVGLVLADVAHAEAGLGAMATLDFDAAARHFAASRSFHPSQIFPYFPRHVPGANGPGEVAYPRWMNGGRARRYWGLHAGPSDIDALVSAALRRRNGDGSSKVDPAEVRVHALKAKRALGGYLTRWATDDARSDAAREETMSGDGGGGGELVARQLNTVLCALWAETGEAGRLEEKLDARLRARVSAGQPREGADPVGCRPLEVIHEVDEAVLAPVLVREGRHHALALLVGARAAGEAMEVWAALHAGRIEEAAASSGAVFSAGAASAAAAAAAAALLTSTCAAGDATCADDVDLACRHVAWILAASTDAGLAVLTAPGALRWMPLSRALAALEPHRATAAATYLAARLAPGAPGESDPATHTQYALALFAVAAEANDALPAAIRAKRELTTFLSASVLYSPADVLAAVHAPPEAEAEDEDEAAPPWMVPALVVLHGRLGDHGVALRLLLRLEGGGDAGEAAAVSYCVEQARRNERGYEGRCEGWWDDDSDGGGEEEAKEEETARKEEETSREEETDPELVEALRLSHEQFELEEAIRASTAATEETSTVVSRVSEEEPTETARGRETDDEREAAAPPELTRALHRFPSPGLDASAALLSLYLSPPPHGGAPNLAAAARLLLHPDVDVDPLAATEMLPDDVALTDAMPFLEAAIRRSVRERNRAEMVRELWAIERTRAAEALTRERSKAVVMLEETSCAGCGVGLGKTGALFRPFAAVPRRRPGGAANNPNPTNPAAGRPTYGVMGGDKDDAYDLLCYRCHLSREHSGGLFDDGDDKDVSSTNGDDSGVAPSVPSLMEQERTSRESKSATPVRGHAVDCGSGGTTRREALFEDDEEGGDEDPSRGGDGVASPVDVGRIMMELEGLFEDGEDDVDV